MEVGSSTEMGAPGASHLGTGDHGPKPTEQTTISPGNAHGACIVPVPCDREIVTPCRLLITNLEMARPDYFRIANKPPRVVPRCTEINGCLIEGGTGLRALPPRILCCPRSGGPSARCGRCNNPQL